MDFEEYNDLSLNSTHPWYYKFHFGIPKQQDKDFPKRSKLKIREYTPDSESTGSGVKSFVGHPLLWREVTLS
jgi:hypothetical protein